jgi:hypothetical protein
MSRRRIAIPFEQQSDTDSNRTCGAACLAMVYRSFDEAVPQSEIWPEIARRNRSGSLACTTHLMVRNAQQRGLAAIAVQARDPLQTLRICRDSGIRAILNTRLQPDSPLGHYLVLLDMDDAHVTVHDPYFGPARSLPHAELLQLWQVQQHDAEISGNVLIGIAAAPPARETCQECHAPLPLSVVCPRCESPVSLAPQPLVGCMADACKARMWNYLCCSACDFTWNFGVVDPDQQNGGAPSPASAAQDADPWKLGAVFEAIDKFSAAILANPRTTSNLDIIGQLNFITASKDRLKLAFAETQTSQQAQQERLVAMMQAAQQAQKEHRRKMRELTTPLALPDGNALADALLENLGFTK